MSEPAASGSTVSGRGRPVGGGDLVFVHVGFGDRAAPYEAAWELQRRTHARRAAGEISDAALLLEHRPVYTAGKRTAAEHRPGADAGAPVVDVDRGGSITWHGPGQLTCYPIVKLATPVNLVSYVRLLESVMMGACADLGLPTIRVEGRTGLWVAGAPDRKIGSIGVRVSRGVTMHGFQINCCCDLEWFERIVPCGIGDAAATSLSRELGRTVPVAEVVPLVERHLAETFGAAGTFHRTLAQLAPPEAETEAAQDQALAL